MSGSAVPEAGRARRRVPRLVWFLLVVALLVVALVIADRVAERLATQATAQQLRMSQHLPQDPEVSFGGFSFLFQAVRGRFDEVDVAAADIPTPVVPVARASVRLFGVQAGLRDALDGQLTTVPVARAEGSVSLRYVDLDPLVASRLTEFGVLSSLRDPVLSERDGRLAVTATVDVFGRPVPVEVDCGVATDAAGVSVVPQRARLPLLGDQALPAEIGARLAVRIPTQDLPFGLRVSSVAVTPDTLEVSGDSTGFVLGGAG